MGCRVAGLRLQAVFSLMIQTRESFCYLGPGADRPGRLTHCADDANCADDAPWT